MSVRNLLIISMGFYSLMVTQPLSGNTTIHFATDRLVIMTQYGRQVFDVEVARSMPERMQGLMYRKSLGERNGMLFDYGTSESISMWMKDTLIPLDMIFIENNGRIESIVKQTIPHSLKPIGSMIPVRAVLELNGGSADKFNIRVGDYVEHTIFKNNGASSSQ